MTTDSDPPQDVLDAAAFSDLFDANFADIWNYLRRRVEARDDADDLSAEVFTIAWRRRHQLPPSDEQRLWLFGVARNTLHNHERSTARRLRLVGRLQDDENSNGSLDLLERDDSLWHALARLNESDRDLLLMRAWDQLPVGDIAVLLACTPNAVSLRLHKARGRLETELERGDPHRSNSTTNDTSQKDPKQIGNEPLESTPKGDSP